MDAVLNFIKFVLDTVNKFFFICEGPHYRRQPLRLPQNKTNSDFKLKAIGNMLCSFKYRLGKSRVHITHLKSHTYSCF